jgi:arylsulfatase A-like enzyme
MKKFTNPRLNTINTGFLAAGLLTACGSPGHKDNTPERPNLIIIFADDQGYNDLGCFGSQSIRTPRIDRMASEGLRMTSFYAQPVSGPSRGALLTGRYPLRIGGGWRTNSNEVTIAEVLKNEGYATCCIGKWDVSDRKNIEGLVPNDQGFDYYFGTLGANDRGRAIMYRNRDSLYITEDMSAFTRTYTDEALRFIEESREKPFFLYLAHTMPHKMIEASEQFKGRSEGGLYGDVIEEIDWNTGRIMDLLEELDLTDNTYVAYFSDNGPWSNVEEKIRKMHDGQLATGSAYPLRSAKGSPYEGGFREPCVFWAPHRIPAGKTSDEMMATIDILPTFAALAGARLPDNLELDGIDQSALITGKTKKGARDIFYYHVQSELQAMRKGDWKILLPDGKKRYNYVDDPPRTEPELYNLKKDISEQNNLSEKHPEILQVMLEMAMKGPTDTTYTGW